MSMPFYVSPEQLMKDRADFARKGIARGRSVVVVQYADGVLFVSENPSQALHKVSEIYDRIAFAAVGRYNEFENLRIAGVRLADMRGYAYDRRDVTGRGLANAYAQTLGTIFSSGGEKPYEVEIFVAEVGDTRRDDQIYRLTYDGQVADEHGYAVMGGAADVVAAYLKEHYAEGASLADALRLAVAALGHTDDRRPGDPGRGPRGRRPRPHPHPAAQVPPARARPADRRCSATAAPRPAPERLSRLGRRRRRPRPGAAVPSPAARRPAPTRPTRSAATSSPLEDPVSGEPPADAPPLRLRSRRLSRSPLAQRSCGLVTNRSDSSPVELRFVTNRGPRAVHSVSPGPVVQRRRRARSARSAHGRSAGIADMDRPIDADPRRDPARRVSGG